MPTSDNPADSFLSSAVTAANNYQGPITETEIQLAELITGQWYQPIIEGFRWNKLYPYKFSVVRVIKSGIGPVYAEVPGWSYTLPIPPKSMSVQTITADKVEATLGGYHQRVNGVTFEQITIKGTTGVLPLKGANLNFGPAAIAQSVLSGPIDVVQSAIQAADLDTFKPSQQLVPDSTFLDPTNKVSRSSGYYQFAVLREFLRNWLSFSRTQKGKDYRLAFCSYKDQAHWLVSINPWSLERSAESPWTYNYTIPLTAFAKVNLGVDPAASNDYKPAVETPDKIGPIVKTLMNTREDLENARNTISALGGDIQQKLFDPLRQLLLFGKDLVGLPLSFADLPPTVAKAAKGAVLSWAGSKKNSTGTKDSFPNASQDLADTMNSIIDLVTSTGQTDTRTGNLQTLDSLKKQQFQVDKGNDPFENPESNYAFFSQVSTTQVNLEPAVTRKISDERTKVRQYTRKTFDEMRQSFIETLSDFEASAGVAGETYTSLTSGKENSTRETTDEDWVIIQALNDLIIQTGKLAASRNVNRFKVTSLDYVAGLFSKAGLAFTKPVSKFAVPFPYGNTLENLAQRYLGDPDRWSEIAQLNGLKSPYVDEEGFSKDFLVDGSGNDITVSDADDLILGQSIWIQSNNKPKTQRRITRIQTYEDFATITVNGDADMGDYRYLADAKLYAYLPDTVNSQQLIYIPSSVPLDEEAYATRDIPDVDEFDPLVVAGGISFLLDSKNDLVVTPDGGTKWAVGLQNIIQNTRIRLSLVQGTLLHHPLVGLPIKVGQSLADLNVNQLAKAVRDLFADNPTYVSAKHVAVQVNGPVAKIAFDLQIPGFKQNVPVSFTTQLR